MQPQTPDKSLQQKLDGITAMPQGVDFNTPAVWQKLEQGLGDNKKTKAKFWYYAAAVLTLIFSAGAFLIQPAKQTGLALNKNIGDTPSHILLTNKLPGAIAKEKKQMVTNNITLAKTALNKTMSNRQLDTDNNKLVLVYKNALKNKQPMITNKIAADERQYDTMGLAAINNLDTNSLVQLNEIKTAIVVKKKMKVVHLNETQKTDESSLAENGESRSGPFHFKFPNAAYESESKPPHININIPRVKAKSL